MSYAVLSNPLTREAYDRNLRVSEARYSELNPAHSEKCGQLTLYWHRKKDCSVRSLQERRPVDKTRSPLLFGVILTGTQDLSFVASEIEP